MKVWQITLTKQQSETRDEHYKGSGLVARAGGTTLGWTIPGTPEGATGYHANTQITGAIPKKPGKPDDYLWWQDVTGEAWYTVDGKKEVRLKKNRNRDFDFGYWLLGTDSRDNPDDRKIFALDSPGINAGVNNNIYLTKLRPL